MAVLVQHAGCAPGLGGGRDQRARPEQLARRALLVAHRARGRGVAELHVQLGEKRSGGSSSSGKLTVSPTANGSPQHSNCQASIRTG